MSYLDIASRVIGAKRATPPHRLRPLEKFAPPVYHCAFGPAFDRVRFP
jgi:hypothetical protein